ncbi:MAG TPA: hypothetical protein DEB40_06660 [Elusimicrobia bacterium]|nr:hypothetical protein [Elusimicrobiota bacterium]HBT61409.1 hypothetical protein [Elusimicrobiota bacterium]
MARPRTEPVDVRRREILNAARGILIRTKYQDLNLDEVARKADVAKGTLYLYFRDKNDLLFCVFVDMLEALEKRLDRVAPADGTISSLLRLAKEELDFVDETLYFLAPFSPGSSVLCGPSGAGSTQRWRFKSHLDIFARRLQACAASGLLRRGDPFDGALYLISLVRMFMLRKFMRGSKRPLRQDAARLVKLLLHGLGGDKS